MSSKAENEENPSERATAGDAGDGKEGSGLGGGNHTHKKRHRHRKKQFYASILKQMEFYFSDAALSKDRFLSQLIMKDPYVSIDVFLTFNKIKSITDKASDITKALAESTLLTLSEDGTKVKRTNPLLPYNADRMTVYVESIPHYADIKWLTDVFQVYGPIAYISLPKYHNSNRIKGFAFVEFQTAKDAEKCIKAFTEMGCKLPATFKPEELASCTMSQADLPESDVKTEDRKTKFTSDKESENDEPPSKRIKTQSECSDINCPDNESGNNISLEDNINENSECEEGIDKKDKVDKKKKLARKRKKKDKKKPIKDLEKRGLESLQVLSKIEWKVLRNKYLTLQRKNMKVLKQVLRTQHTLPENRLNFPQSSFPVSEEETVDNSKETTESKLPEIPFVEGVIVAAKLAEPCTNVKQLKHATKANVHVKFVDVKEGSFDIYIRMDSNETAKQMVSGCIFPEARILTGAEEQTYWDELRTQQSGRSSSKRKIRGRDRLIKKAEDHVKSVGPITQIGKHIRFDE